MAHQFPIELGSGFPRATIRLHACRDEASAVALAAALEAAEEELGGRLGSDGLLARSSARTVEAGGVAARWIESVRCEYSWTACWSGYGLLAVREGAVVVALRLEWWDGLPGMVPGPVAEALVFALRGVRTKLRRHFFTPEDRFSAWTPLETYFESANDLVRARAAQALGERFRRDEASASLLHPLLDDPSAIVRAKAVEALSMVAEDQEALRAAILRALADESPAVRVVAAAQLPLWGPRGRVVLPESLPILVVMLEDPLPAVRVGAAMALDQHERRIDEEQVAEIRAALKAAAERETDGEVRERLAAIADGFGR